MNLPWAKRPLFDALVKKSAQSSSHHGIAIVIVCCNNGQFLSECLQRIERQTAKPAAVVIVETGSAEAQILKALGTSQQEDVRIVQHNGGVVPAKNAGIDAVLSSGLQPIALAFLSAKDRLVPSFVATCESVLQRYREVGLVSGWMYQPGSNMYLRSTPCPSFPYQWISNEALPFSAVRTEALLEAGSFRSAMAPGYEDWDLFNAVMAAGWVAVTVPEVLGTPGVPAEATVPGNDARRELLERFPDLVARDETDICLLTESMIAHSQHGNRVRLGERLAEARMMLRNPAATASVVLRKAKGKIVRQMKFRTTK
jgi:hypothetical protein